MAKIPSTLTLQILRSLHKCLVHVHIGEATLDNPSMHNILSELHSSDVQGSGMGETKPCSLYRRLV